jgi:hypothetical protein
MEEARHRGPLSLGQWEKVEVFFAWEETCEVSAELGVSQQSVEGAKEKIYAFL